MTFSSSLCTVPLLVTQIVYFISGFKLELRDLKGEKPPEDGKVCYY